MKKLVYPVRMALSNMTTSLRLAYGMYIEDAYDTYIHNTRVGKLLTRIKFGCLHIFGKTPAQKLQAQVDQAVSHIADQSLQMLAKELVRNQITLNAFQDNDLHKKIFTPSMAIDVLNKCTARELVGVQPFTGPIGFVYLLELLKSTPADVDAGQTKINFAITSHPCVMNTRRLSVKWTLEASQDFRYTLHGQDADINKEIGKVLATEVASSMNTEILTSIKNIATKGDDVVGSLPEEMLLAINQAANDIARRTRRGAGNFVVVNWARVAFLLCSARIDYTPADTSVMSGASGLQLIGTLSNGLKIYAAHSSAGIAEDEILVGYKGTSGEMDAGYIWCPYVLLMTAGLIVDPNTFQPAHTLMTRYGTHQSDNVADYYQTFKFVKSEPQEPENVESE